jgi:hypothetical protein
MKPRRAFVVLVAVALAFPLASVSAQPVPPGPETWALLDPGLGPRHGHTVTYDPIGDRLILFGGDLDAMGVVHLNDLWELSLGTDLVWRPLVAQGTPPPPRADHTAIYDAANQRIVIFGGSGFQLHEDTDVWMLSLGATPAWTHLTPPGTLPENIQRHAAIYDPVGQRMIAFGGTLAGTSDEVWILNLSGSPAWTGVTPPGPMGNRLHSPTATYDPVGQRMIVIGGGSGTDTPTTALSLSGPMVWTQLAPISGPEEGDYRDVSGHVAIYHPPTNSILMFAGDQSNLPSNHISRLCRLSLGATPTWTLLSPQGVLPHDRIDHAAVFDPSGNRLVVYGGLVEGDHSSATVQTQEHWILSLTGAPTWSEVRPSGAQPPRRWQAAMAADPTGQRMVVSGGFFEDDSYTNQIHAKSTTGEQLWQPIIPSGTGPPGTAGHTIIVDTANHRLVMFGGGTASVSGYFTDFTNEVWTAPLGPNPTWTQLFPAGDPPTPRSHHTAIYDAANQRMVIFGGKTGFIETILGDAMALSLDGNPTWSSLSSIPARWGHTAVYDAPRHRMIVFGGRLSDGSYTDDVWEMLLDDGVWYDITATGDGPGDRAGHSAVYDPVGHRMIVFGGSSSGGLSNSAYSLSLWNAPEWKPLDPIGTKPSARQQSAYGYDAAGGRMIVFGGVESFQVDPRFDTWALTLNSCPPPFITMPPAGATLPYGMTATLSVTATGAVGYHWRKDDVPLSDGGRISGALTPSLSILNFQVADVGAYSVQVFGQCDTIVSAAVALQNGCVAVHANPPQHMAAWWAMDPGVGNSVPDVLNTKSNKNHASLTGDATLVPGLVGTAVRCDGVDDGLHVPVTLSPELAKNSTGLSIDAWIYPRSGSSTDAFRMILAKGLLSHNQVNANGMNQLAPGYALYLHGGGQLGFQMPNTNFDPVRIEPALTPMSMDNWHHVAVALTPQPGGGALYVDGVRVHTFTPPSGIIGNLADLYIGRFPPQLGPQVADSTFSGDIDEVEIFTAAVDSSDIRKIWAAGCKGKRREMALLHATTLVRQSTGQAEVCGSVTNFAAAPASYQWTLEALPAGAGCPDNVPVSFTPSSGSFSVGPGDFGAVTATATINGSLDVAFQSCYRLTVTNLGDGGTFTADGSLVFVPGPVHGAASCTPPQVSATAAPPAERARTRPVRTTLPGATRAARAGAATSGGEGQFSVSNDSTDAIEFVYEISTRNPDTGAPSSIIGLGGQAPGVPLTGSIPIPAQSTIDLFVDVALDDHEPFLRDQVVLSADLDGDLANEAMASTFVISSEDTSLAITAVIPGAGGPRALVSLPNPFRSSTLIAFTLPQARSVEVAVFDVLGRRVRMLRSGRLAAGEQRIAWDGRRDDGGVAGGGLYFIRVDSGEQRLSTKVVRIQ